jgi:hypothetical protein
MSRTLWSKAAVALLFLAAACLAGSPAANSIEVVAQTVGTAKGPLRGHPKNPRYFTDGSGRAIYFTLVAGGDRLTARSGSTYKEIQHEDRDKKQQ